MSYEAMEQLRKVNNPPRCSSPYPRSFGGAIGRLAFGQDGHVVIGNGCLREDEINEGMYTPIYYVNIGPLYSQYCARCGGLLVKGTADVELFDGKRGA